MFNKDLLLSGGKKKLDGIWEITVGVYLDDDGYGTQLNRYGYSNFSVKFGSLKRLYPESFVFGTNGESWDLNIGVGIQGLYSARSRSTYRTITDNFNFVNRNQRPNLSDTTVFIHLKSDTGIRTAGFYYDLNAYTSSLRHTAPDSITWAADALFQPSDLNKTYRMYIGPLDTPPRGSKPLFFRQLFNLSEGCLDVQQQSAFHQQRFNNRCHYYQRLRSGWCNRIRQILRASFAGGNQDHQASDWRDDHSVVSRARYFGRVIYLESLRQHFLEHYKKLSNRLSNGRNVSAIRRFVLSVFASHTMGGAYA